MNEQDNEIDVASLPTLAEVEIESIKRALNGDAEEGAWLLKECHRALVMEPFSLEECFSPALRAYFADRIKELMNGVEPSEALRIKKPKGRPKVAIVKWQLEIASFGYWLIKKGLSVNKAKVKMHEARLHLYKRGIDPREAGRVLGTFDNLPNFSNDDLVANMGNYDVYARQFLDSLARSEP